MLTDRQVQAAITKAKTDAVLNDGAQAKGGGSLRLKIRVGTRGTTATWFAWWQVRGKPVTQSLGRYPDMTLADARVAAANAVAGAKNPAAATVEANQRTVAKLFAAYVDALRQDKRRSAGEVEAQLARAAAILGPETAASDVTPGHLTALLKTIHDRGARVMADRMRSYLRAAFSWGMKAANDYRAKTRQDWGIKSNPAALVKRDTGANVTRERNLSAAELKTLWRALDREGFADGTGAAIRLLICCGQRILETMRVAGADIDLEARLWSMPGHKTKGGLPHVLPLPSQAVDVLRPLIEQHGQGPLFPAQRGESDLQRGTSLNKAMRRWSRATDFPDFQARDLRRTWKSRTADAGIDRHMRDVIQQHARGGDTGSKHYDRATYLPQMREAMGKWEVWLSENVTG